ncbi:MAG: hydrogenase subunit MbhD domain-containing protein [Candidatus Methanoperedens sp.]|nr:hydrogenase subunit MbhD domain-containing protein [Candidatus Methanoperedens sp.]
MIMIVDLVMLLFVIILAIASITVKDLLESTVLFAGFSFMMAVIWVEMNSVDVAFTEAAVGAGVSTILLVAAIACTKRYEEEK